MATKNYEAGIIIPVSKDTDTKFPVDVKSNVEKFTVTATSIDSSTFEMTIKFRVKSSQLHLSRFPFEETDIRTKFIASYLDFDPANLGTINKILDPKIVLNPNSEGTPLMFNLSFGVEGGKVGGAG
jgi:hypothetical protein